MAPSLHNLVYGQPPFFSLDFLHNPLSLWERAGVRVLPIFDIFYLQKSTLTLPPNGGPLPLPKGEVKREIARIVNMKRY
jgi:hypothetical protein